jgi:hypothetical protein
MVRYALKLVSEGFKMTRHAYATNEKAPGAINTEGLDANTTNNLNSATGERLRKALATLIAQLAMRGHAVHTIEGGGFFVCKYGHCYHAKDFADMQDFARRLGLSQ